MFYIQWLGYIWNACGKCARDNRLDPKDWTNKNIASMKNQLKDWSFLDWSREISTCSEEYYKHQQLFF